jgi:hypothetical protein
MDGTSRNVAYKALGIICVLLEEEGCFSLNKKTERREPLPLGSPIQVTQLTCGIIRICDELFNRSTFLL